MILAQGFHYLLSASSYLLPAELGMMSPKFFRRRHFVYGQHRIWLEITSPAGRVSRREFAGMRLVIGRLPEVDVHLDDGSVSRRHAEIHHDTSDNWWVRDLGSRNGTLVDGQAAKEHPIKAGSTIQVGQFILKVLAVGGAEPPPAPPSEPSPSVTMTMPPRDRIA